MGFTANLVLTTDTVYHRENRSITGPLVEVARGRDFFASIGVLYPLYTRMTDFSAPYHLVETTFVTRRPVPRATYQNVVRPFTPGVWALLSLAALVFGAAFTVAHTVYSGIGGVAADLARPEPSAVNFFLYPLAKITEPDPLPWFGPAAAAGTLLVFCWSLLGLFSVFFYNCNLRAYLTVVDYEHPLETMEDVVANGQRVWIQDGANQMRLAGEKHN